MNEPQEPCRSVAPMTATDLGLRNTFNCWFATTFYSFFIDCSESARGHARMRRSRPFCPWFLNRNVHFAEESIRKPLLLSKEKEAGMERSGEGGIGDEIDETATSIRRRRALMDR